jgi:hypothetical protein
MEIITPNNVIKIVLDRKTTDFRLKFYKTSFQKFCFIGSVVSLIFWFVAGICFRITGVGWLGIVSLIAYFATTILVVIYQMAQIIPEARRLKNPERDISASLVNTFNDDMDLIYHLSTSFESHHLSYAKEMYGKMARQLRERIGLLVGALDKIGIVPIAVTAYLTYSRAIKEGLSFGPYEWVGISFVLLYLLAIRMTSTAQWMEHVAEIYAHAYSFRISRQSN